MRRGQGKIYFSLIGALLFIGVMGLSQAAGRKWAALLEDGIHDPANPAMRVLQQPAEAMSRLPEGKGGNRVDWVRALEQGVIRPRSGIRSNAGMPVRETSIMMRNTGEMSTVDFPHRQHTMWLGCDSCHEDLYSTKKRGAPVSMSRIQAGESCGRCHGTVAFPWTECDRCHTGVGNSHP